MTEHRTRLIDRKVVAADTMTFSFEKPMGFVFRAGQFATFVLPNGAKNDRGHSHHFTLAGAPHETNLMIVTRMRDSAYKRRLGNLPIGGEATLRGPSGSFTLPDDEEAHAVFIAGGIGITPYLSMLRHARHVNRPGRITLFNSNRRPEDAAFLDELRQLDQKAKNVEIVNTMTAEDDSVQERSGETGHIDAAMLKRHLGDLSGPIYYAAGPPDMVSAMEDMLQKTEIKNDRIKAEQFSGY